MLETLGIQWPKLIAQFVNFAIVLFVLWRFAYKPVFTMLEARRQKIADGHRQRRENQGGARQDRGGAQARF